MLSKECVGEWAEGAALKGERIWTKFLILNMPKNSDLATRSLPQAVLPVKVFNLIGRTPN